MLGDRLTGFLLALFLLALTGMAWWRPEVLLRAGVLLGMLFALGWFFAGSAQTRSAPGILLPALLLTAGWVFSGVGANAALRGSILVGVLVVAAAVTFATMLSPRLGGWIHERWLAGAQPIAWCVSRLLLALIYYIVLTPMGLIMRFSGRDILGRRCGGGAESSWFEREEHPGLERYFRQY